MSSNTLATLNEMKQLIAEGQYTFFNGDESKKYVISVGMSSAAIRSLLKAGMIERSTKKFCTQFYRITEKGAAV